MIIGAHISTQGGLVNVFNQATNLGVKAIQIHPSQPKQWAKPKITDEEATEFKKQMKSKKLGPLFFHAIYLINFASTDQRIWHGSITATKNYLELALKMGASGVVTHLGSTKGANWLEAKKRILDGLRRVFDECSTGILQYARTAKNQIPKFIIETAAGAGNIIGDDIDEVAEIFQAIKNNYPCGICIDTAHLFESGAPIHVQNGLDDLLEKIDQKIGLKNLIAVHFNDSATEFGSKRDRHENIGMGQIGNEALARIINHPKLKDLPFILEVPGFYRQGPDRKNVKKVLEFVK